ncbi:TPA: ADP-forming succinate--CoA ligase subunit beta [Candidatus Poribacteria bacterium]|nr:ADP-forming succinate--CoA ligase subunit beta [Candidatus Poribacteria bacterium]
MNIHEYQAKEILQSHGVNVPMGKMADTPERAERSARALGCARFVVKAQIHAGGRGKGGGIRLADSPEKVKRHAEQMIGMRLVTHQTGPKGKLVRKVLIEEAADIKKELYLSIIVDRDSSRPVIMGSEEGGMDIEEVAASHPEMILTETIDVAVGLMPFQTRRLAYGLKIPNSLVNRTSQLMLNLYNTFVVCDCSLAEINPLAITADNKIIALDAKLSFDDNALFRHKEIAALLDEDEENPRELEASKHGLSYVSLDGNIGCMVNGAGLAMATMDLIKLHGGEPANFLDVGGGASIEQVTQAFKIILADEKVRAILVNIFGGIMRCDVIAEGIIAAVKEVGTTSDSRDVASLHVPLVVRLEGTNVDIGRELLTESGLNIISADGLENAAEKVVEVVRTCG